MHYYQQPGDDHAVDSTRTSLSGHAEQLKFGKYGGGITRFETSVVRQSAGFEVNDIGFLRRADMLDWSTWAALSFREARGIYRWAQVNGNHWETWNTSGTRLENALNFNGHMGLNNNWDVHLGGTFGRLTESYCDRCTRGGPALRQSRGLLPVGRLQHRQPAHRVGGNVGEPVVQRRGQVPRLVAQPVRELPAVAAAAGQRRQPASRATGTTRSGTATSRIPRARRTTRSRTSDQRTVSMSTRLNYTVTPDLTFEFYGEPFVATGTYSDVREVSATPDAARYDERFRPYTPPAGAQTSFKFTQLRTNAVVRWEYRPGPRCSWCGRTAARTPRTENPAAVVDAGLSRPVRAAPGQHVPGEDCVLAEPVGRGRGGRDGK